jgi:hypothetical protein
VSKVVYLYGFVPQGAPEPPANLRGLEDGPVELVELEAFRAVVSRLPADEYGEGRLEARLPDLGWVAPRGLSHERVVTWFADHGSIIPARLLTLFSSEAALVAQVRERADAVQERLERFRDFREWDVKVSYDMEELGRHLGEFSDEVAELDREIAGSTPGRRYLLERRRDDLIRRECGSTAGRLARDLLRDLATVAEEVAEFGVPNTDRDLPVVLNAALLVNSGRRGELEQAAATRAEGLRSKGLHLSVTGPWAPYRFAGGTQDG